VRVVVVKAAAAEAERNLMHMDFISSHPRPFFANAQHSDVYIAYV
jgi:hypothetical protein